MTQPVNETIIDLKKDLKKVLEQTTLRETFRTIKQCLRNNSPARNDLTLLEGRLRDLNSKDIRGTLSFGEYTQEENRIRDAILRFIDYLPEEEFNLGKRNERKKPVIKYRMGKVRYFLPNKMQIGRELECEVKISVEDDLLEKAPQSVGSLHQRHISVSDSMYVTLTGRSNSPFEIEALNDEIQLVTNSGNTSWTFFVKPLSEGIHLLLLKVAMGKLEQGIFVKKEEVLREKVQVVSESVEYNDAIQQELSMSFFLPVVTFVPLKITSPTASNSSFTSLKSVLIGVSSILFMALAFFKLSPDMPDPVVVPPAPAEEPLVAPSTIPEVEPPVLLPESEPPKSKLPIVRVPGKLPTLPYSNPLAPVKKIFEGVVYMRIPLYSRRDDDALNKSIRLDMDENRDIDTIRNGFPYQALRGVKVTNAQNPNQFDNSNHNGRYSLLAPDSNPILLVHAKFDNKNNIDVIQSKYQRYRSNNDIFLECKKRLEPIKVSYKIVNSDESELLVPAPNVEISLIEHSISAKKGNREIIGEEKLLGNTDESGFYNNGFEPNFFNEKLVFQLKDECNRKGTVVYSDVSELDDTSGLQFILPISKINSQKIQLKKGKKKSVTDLIPEPAFEEKTIKVFSTYNFEAQKKSDVMIGTLQTDERGWVTYKIKPDAATEGINIELVEDESGEYYVFWVNPKLFKRNTFEIIFKNKRWNINTAIDLSGGYCGATIRGENRKLIFRKNPIFSGGIHGGNH